MGSDDVRPDLPAHTPGTPKGEERIRREGRESNRENQLLERTGPDATRTKAAPGDSMRFMKPTQWVLALVVLVGVVFGVTFLMQYLGSSPGTSGGQQEAVLVLNWEATQPPPEQGLTQFPTLAQMLHQWSPLTGNLARLPKQEQWTLVVKPSQEGSFDYWFENSNDRSVALGLRKLSCKCAGLQVFVVPPEARAMVAEIRAGLPALGTASPPLGVLLAGFPRTLSETAPGLLEKRWNLKGETLKDAENEGESVVIPPGACGWVRLSWKGQEVGERKQLEATLWMSRKQETVSLRGFIQARRPLRVAQDRRVLGGDEGLFPTDDQPYADEILAWSPTLTHPEVTREVIGLVGKDHADPFTVGAPEFLSPEECAELSEKERDVVRSAFRVPIVIRARGADGQTPIDYGRFRRHVRLGIKDAGEEDVVSVIVEGRINGPVEVVRGTQQVPYIDFQTFPASARGEAQPVKVRRLASEPPLKLTVDEQRTAPFLKVELDTEPTREGSYLVWNLKVGIEPNRVHGRFPDERDPNYRDCAIYLRAGDDPRRYRLPVAGTAQ